MTDSCVSSNIFVTIISQRQHLSGSEPVNEITNRSPVELDPSNRRMKATLIQLILGEITGDKKQGEHRDRL